MGVPVDPQLTNLVVSAEEIANIDAILKQLVAESGSSYCMLLDHSGQVITAQGDVEYQEITALGALLAGSFASSREVARLLRERNFRSTIQLGSRENIFTEMVQEQWILVIIFDRQFNLGLIKILGKRVTGELSQILDRVRKNMRAKDSVISTQFKDSFESTLELLFKD